MRSYDPTWGRFLSKTFPVPGNHEYNTPNAAGFFRYFGRRTFGGRGYYSFDRGAWHIVALDSVRGRLPDERQLRWLRRDLRRNDDRCQVAFFHHPLFTSGTEAPPSPFMVAFWSILFRQGVDVILNGHAHSYERFAKLTPTGEPQPAASVRSLSAQEGQGCTNSVTRSREVNVGSEHTGSFSCAYSPMHTRGDSCRSMGRRATAGTRTAIADGSGHETGRSHVRGRSGEPRVSLLCSTARLGEHPGNVERSSTIGESPHTVVCAADLCGLHDVLTCPVVSFIATSRGWLKHWGFGCLLSPHC